jgi:hypothetical protein
VLSVHQANKQREQLQAAVAEISDAKGTAEIVYSRQAGPEMSCGGRQDHALAGLDFGYKDVAALLDKLNEFRDDVGSSPAPG